MVFDEHGWIQCCSANRIRQLMHKRVNARFALVNPFQAESPISTVMDWMGPMSLDMERSDVMVPMHMSHPLLEFCLMEGRSLCVIGFGLCTLDNRMYLRYCLLTVEIAVRECTIYDSRA